MIRKTRAALMAAIFVAAAACSQDITTPAPADALFAKGGNSGPGGQSGTTLVSETTAATEWRCVNGVARLFVVGSVTVTNGGAVATQDLKLVGKLEYRAPGSNTWTQTSYGFTVIPAAVQPGVTYTYDYAIQLASWNDAATYRSSVQITITNHSGSLGTAKGPNPKSSFLVVDEPIDLCAVTCTLTQGYWKTHGPAATGNNTNQWPVSSLTLGSLSYDAAQLQSIFDASGGGNGLITLAHQLIAAKLNVAAGANPAAVASAISAADALIGSLVIPPVGGGFLAPSVTASLTTALDNYNRGLTGPGHCD